MKNAKPKAKDPVVLGYTKLHKLYDLDAPRPVSTPRLEKGLSKGDRKRGWTTYVSKGRATI